MQFHFHATQSHFHKNGFGLRLALKQRHKGTRKWPIAPSLRHISALIHARVVGSFLDVVKLRDQMLRVAGFSCGFFTAMAGNKEPGVFYVLLCS